MKNQNRLKKLFPGYIKNSATEISTLWKKAYISFDANVLLNLYRYSDSTKSEFIRVILGVKDRTFITHQAFEEYLRNRHTVISNQIKLYSKKDIDSLKKTLEEKNLHPVISSKTNELFNEFYDALSNDYESAVKKLNERFAEDDIFKSLETVFNVAVLEGFDPKHIEDVIFKDGKERYLSKIPPGFEDQKAKSGDESYEGLRRLYGDLIVWMELIKYSKDNNRNVIFVTSDKKEDWWKIVDGKTISPRPELLAEFSKMTGCELVMYTSEQFLKFAGENLNEEPSSDSLEEVRQYETPDFSKGVRVSRKSQFSPDSYVNYLSKNALEKNVWHRLGYINGLTAAAQQAMPSLSAFEAATKLAQVQHPSSIELQKILEVAKLAGIQTPRNLALQEAFAEAMTAAAANAEFDSIDPERSSEAASQDKLTKNEFEHEDDNDNY